MEPPEGGITLEDVLAGTGGRLADPDVTGGRACPGVAFRAVGIDSRTIGAGDLFVAVRGEVHDGHRFVPDAVARGAAGALIEAGRAAEFAGLDAPLVEVGDTTAALGALAAHWRGKVAAGLHVVGITGSVGKSKIGRAHV